MISCLMATFDRPLFARRAIALFHRQTWKRKELIVLHDGPRSEIPTDLGPGVRWVNFNGYEGMTRKARWGMAIASGELLATWDDDDYFGPRRLTVQAEPIIDGHADATGFPVDFILDVPAASFWKWKTPIRPPVTAHRPEPRPQAFAVPFHDGSAMYRRELLNGIPDRIREASQIKLLETMGALGGRLKVVPNDGHFVYVRHGRNGWAFKTEDRCRPVERPDWFPDLDFYKNPELAR